MCSAIEYLSYPTVRRRSQDLRTTIRCQVGCPIRKSRDQRVLSPPPGLSQSAASFIASYRQGIHQTPFSRLIRSRRQKTASWLSPAPLREPPFAKDPPRDTGFRSVLLDLERHAVRSRPPEGRQVRLHIRISLHDVKDPDEPIRLKRSKRMRCAQRHKDPPRRSYAAPRWVWPDRGCDQNQ